MANEEQLKILRQGAEAWNKWRRENPDEHIDLSEANLSKANLRGAELIEADLRGAELMEADLRGAYLIMANLSGANLNGADLLRAKLSKANLSEANLSEANLRYADLYKANLSNANLIEADLYKADLREADLRRANLRYADLYEANLSNANLSEANLSEANLRYANLGKANLGKADLMGAYLGWANLSEANFEKATLTGCNIYAISAWGLELEGAMQNDMVITPPNQPVITVDNLEVAQFIYLLIHNEKIRKVIDTITSKVVLILGRFTDTRKPVLDAIRDELRNRDYLPVLFDFDKSANRDIAETVSTLAHMARFIIADITDAKSVPAELEHIVPQLLSVSVKPLILNSDYEYALFERIGRFKCVLEPYRYENQAVLIASLKDNVIKPAEEKADELKKELEKIRSGS